MKYEDMNGNSWSEEEITDMPGILVIKMGIHIAGQGLSV
jgi:hypothetical protein